MWNDKIEGDFRAEEDLAFAGMVTGTLTVAPGATLELHGRAARLVVEPGGCAVVHGTVSGAVVNAGGVVRVHGTVGSLATDPEGSTQVLPGAVVGGVTH